MWIGRSLNNARKQPSDRHQDPLTRCIVKGHDLVLASTGFNIIPLHAGWWSQKTPSDQSIRSILGKKIEQTQGQVIHIDDAPAIRPQLSRIQVKEQISINL